MDSRLEERLDKIAKRRGWSAEKVQQVKDSYRRKQEARAADKEDWTEEFRGLAAIPAEAMSLGVFGDEFRAGARATVAKAADAIGGTDYAGSWEEEYKLALEDERRVESETYRDYPLASYGTAIAFGMVPALKIGKAAGLGTTFASGAARQGGAAALESAVLGFNEGDADLGERLSNAGMMGAFGGGIGALGGGVAAKYLGDTAADAAKQKVAREVLEDRAADATPAELAEAVNKRMTDKAEVMWRETGEVLKDDSYMRALTETAKELGVPVQKVRNVEGLKFFEEKQFIEQLDDYVPEALSRAQVSWAKDIWQGAITPIVKKAETVVGKNFAGRMQRYATRMAQRGDEVTTFFRDADVQAFGRLMQGAESGQMRAHLLNMSNLNLDDGVRGAEWVKLRELTKEKGGEKAWAGLQKLQARMMQEQARQSKTVNSFIKPDPLYWPAQFKGQTRSLRGRDSASRARQTNMMEQNRPFLQADQALMFENPVVHADNWIRQSQGLSEMFDTFKLQNAEAVYRANLKRTPSEEQLTKAADRARQQVAGGEWAFTSLRERLIQEGADEGTAEHAVSLMRAVAVDGARGPSAIISNFRKAAYMGTIGNPYSAVLNLGDVFNSAVNFGARNTVRGLVDTLQGKGLRVTADDVGLMHQTTGEFLRDGVTTAQRRFDALSDAAFNLSQFRRFDRLGKDTAMTAAIRQNQKRATSASEFAKRWDGIFDKFEQRQLRKDILAGNKTQLVKEMAAAELSKMQPTDMANLPQWFLEHPNARVLWMLRTFGLKQIQQMDDLVVKQWKDGNKKAAIKNALAFTAITGGGNALLQEGRQTLKGKEPNMSLDIADKGLGYRFADHMLGASTANMVSLYGIDRARQTRGGSLIEGTLPPLGIAVAPIVDAMAVADHLQDGDDLDVQAALQESETLGWLPWGRLVKEWMKDE